jgi:periplasmic divalent cation tolerance protein
MLEVRINCPTLAVAETIATALVGERLAASANIHAEILSIHHWKGRVERAREVPLVLKSRAVLFDRIVRRVRDLHPYEIPPITGYTPACVSEDYLAWLEQESVPDSAN